MISERDPSISFNIIDRERACNDLDAFYSARPLLRNLAQEFGDRSVVDYVIENFKNKSRVDIARQRDFLNIIEKILSKRLNAAIASEVVAQLNKYYCVSTGDHHAPINANLSLCSHLTIASGCAKLADPLLKYIVVLSCASVSLNHEDFPRGILFHSFAQDEFSPQRLSLLPSNSHNCTVYKFRPYKNTDVDKIITILRDVTGTGNIENKYEKKIEHIIESVFKKTEILSSPDLCTQWTKVNFHLWRELFNGADEINDLIYIDIEELTTELILACHLKKDTWIHHLLFDGSYEKLLEDLSHSMERFSRQGNLATYLFWGISKKNYRTKLIKVRNTLMSEDGSVHVPLNPESMDAALRARTIMPNLLTIYTILHVYYGLNCFGGYNQIHYLDSMRKACHDAGHDVFASHASSQLYGYGPQFIYFKAPDTAPQETNNYAYGLDMALYGSPDAYRSMCSLLDQTKLEDIIKTDIKSI